eukprot:7391736-Prymnesium_polylepis.1
MKKGFELIELIEAFRVACGNALSIWGTPIVAGRQVQLSQVAERVERPAVAAEKAEDHCLLFG